MCDDWQDASSPELSSCVCRRKNASFFVAVGLLGGKCRLKLKRFDSGRFEDVNVVLFRLPGGCNDETQNSNGISHQSS